MILSYWRSYVGNTRFPYLIGGASMSFVTINVPKEVVFSLFDSESEFTAYVKMTIAKDLYKNRNVSLEHCE